MEEITPELRAIGTELISGQLSGEHLLMVSFGLLLGLTVAVAHLVSTSVLTENHRLGRLMNDRGRWRVKNAVRDHLEERNFDR